MTALVPLLLIGAAFEPAGVHALTAPLNIWDVAAEDLNGDGWKDIVAVGCDERSHPPEKAVYVYFGRPGFGYPETPDLTLPLDPAVGALFFAEVDGSAPRELIASASEQATIYRYVHPEFEKAGQTTFASILPTAAKQPRFLPHAAEDLTGDGIDEWFIPVATGYELRNAEGSVARVRCDVVGNVQGNNGMAIRFNAPAYQTFSVPGSASKAMAFFGDEVVDFAYGPGWTKHERFEVPLNLGEKWETVSRMADINGDGLPDIMLTQTEGTVNIKGLTQVYIADGPMSFPSKPTATFEVKESFASPILHDVDGDGKLDLILVNIPFGVKLFVNYFLFKRVTVKIDVYLFDGNGYPAQPSYTSSLTIEAPDGNEQATYAMGDFNGDGRADAAIATDADSLAIHLGEAGRFFASRPSLTVAVPSMGSARAEDLNGNGREDLVIFHPFGENKKRIEVILF